jgi:hypothetical protein
VNHTLTRTFHAYQVITTDDGWHLPHCACDGWMPDGLFEHDDDAHDEWLEHVRAVL